MFTEITIQKLKPIPGKRFEKWDSGQGGQKGLGLRVGKKKIFFVKYFFEGRKKRITIGEYPGISLAKARLKAQEALVKVQQGIDPGIEAQQYKHVYTTEPHIEELIKELWDKKLSKLKSGAATRRLLEKDLLKPWGKRKVSTIKTRDIVLLLDQVSERAPVTRNRLHTAINGLFSFAVSRGVIDISPCTNIARVNEKTRERVLTDHEIKQLWNALDFDNKKIDIYPLTKLVLKLILLTGQRPGEVAGMTHGELTEINGQQWWKIPATRMKTKNKHDVPLNTMAWNVVNTAISLSGNSRFIFRSSFKEDSHISVPAISRAVVRHLSEIGVAKFTPHDLRRTCRTGLANLNVSDIVAEKILSHRLQGVLGVYNRAGYEAERFSALGLWEEHIKNITAEQPIKTNIIPFATYRARS